MEDPTYHVVPLISEGRKTFGRQAVELGRTDGSPQQHPPDSNLAAAIVSRTHADQHTFWGQYLMVVGFFPSNTIDQTLKDLHYTVARIGIDVDSRTNHPSYHNSLIVDDEWVQTNYTSNHWAIPRNQYDGKSGGHLIKLERPALFGNFLLVTAFDGTIVPFTYMIRSAEHTTRTYLFMAIPAHVPMRTIQLPDRYPPILAVRSLPIEKDRHALTNGGLATLHIVLDDVIPGQYVIVPVLQYQEVVVSTQNNSRAYTHPDQDDVTRALPAQRRTFAKDCIWEVILMLPNQDSSGRSLEDRTRECQQKVFEKLAKGRTKGHPELDPPFLAHAGGFLFEYMQSAECFLASPRGPVGIFTPACLRVYSIPKDIRARDALNILAQDPRNAAVITSSRAALVVPPVPSCDRENHWRLFILGDCRATLHLDPLDHHMATHFPDDYKPWTENGTIEGLEMYNKLRGMYDRYYSTRTPQVPSGKAITAAPTTAAPAPLSAWNTLPTVPTAMSMAMEQDFPPLPVTVVTSVSSASPPTCDLTRVDQEAQLKHYVQSLFAKELDKVRQETTRALEHVNAKTDTAIASMERKIIIQERNQATSALQHRVDPINRAYESIVSLQRQLQGLQRDRNKTAKSNDLDTAEDLADMDAQIVQERDDIKKAKDRLRQRHAALVQDAQAQQVELDDLVDLDF